MIEHRDWVLRRLRQLRWEAEARVSPIMGLVVDVQNSCTRFIVKEDGLEPIYTPEQQEALTGLRQLAAQTIEPLRAEAQRLAERYAPERL